jgi:hypothetical protein
VPVSELCDKQGLQPTVFCRWQKKFFENGAAAFQQKARPKHSAEQERISYLEEKIQNACLATGANLTAPPLSLDVPAGSAAEGGPGVAGP